MSFLSGYIQSSTHVSGNNRVVLPETLNKTWIFGKVGLNLNVLAKKNICGKIYYPVNKSASKTSVLIRNLLSLHPSFN